MLNQRLLACAGYVQGNFICDVGTDHALLPVYLIQNQIAEKIIASDVREGPLQSAERTITRAGLQDKIQMILSDGLQNVPPDGLTDIIIAGMGGETIIHILETCPFSLEKINLIFQPMTKAELLRKWLYQNGFEIQSETCVPDKKFLYAVMQVRYSGNHRQPDAEEIYFGKMNLQTPDGRAYAERALHQLRKANFQQNPEVSGIITKLEELLK
ncbi:MAG: SAM-dependent methyltransferase [Ruminococcus sp.]|nr:SAM-dependent methyltransferase [Ruminococcus sp.]